MLWLWLWQWGLKGTGIFVIRGDILTITKVIFNDPVITVHSYTQCTHCQLIMQSVNMTTEDMEIIRTIEKSLLEVALSVAGNRRSSINWPPTSYLENRKPQPYVRAFNETRRDVANSYWQNLYSKHTCITHGATRQNGLLQLYNPH